MRRLLLCLLTAVSLGGCGLANQPFSCAPSLSFQRIDRDQYTRPATQDSQGYYHC